MTGGSCEITQALVCDNVSVTRAELDGAANRWARSFAERGVGRGDRVSVLLPNGLALVTAILASWKVGAVPNPLSHRLPAAERDVILDRASPALVVGLDAAEFDPGHAM